MLPTSALQPPSAQCQGVGTDKSGTRDGGERRRMVASAEFLGSEVESGPVGFGNEADI